MRYAFYQQSQNLYPVSAVPVNAAVEYFRKNIPNEAVGFVYGEEFIPMENIHPEPEEFFVVDDIAYISMIRSRGFPDAVLHSHTKGQSIPSKRDMESQRDMGVPFGIAVFELGTLKDILFWGKGTPIAPYKGRPFKFGVYDCYQLVSDWYQQEMNISLPVFPRVDCFWDIAEEEDIMYNHYKGMGFTEIDFSQLRVGDAILFKIFGEKKVNHCGVYVGNGLFLHHIYGTDAKIRLSSYDNLLAWKKFIISCVRHKDALQLPISERYHG